MASLDSSPDPGDIVLVRGTQALPVWHVPNQARSGQARPGAVGLVVSSRLHHHSYSLVLWPGTVGWVQDGQLRKVQRRSPRPMTVATW